jgi:uncharacterized glyoxalase superfamily protein PhnB
MLITAPDVQPSYVDRTKDEIKDALEFDANTHRDDSVAAPANRSAQITIVGSDDMAAPGITIEVDDVDAVHARAVEGGMEIAYSLRDEDWGVRRFMLREPSGTMVNIVSHVG